MEFASTLSELLLFGMRRVKDKLRFRTLGLEWMTVSSDSVTWRAVGSGMRIVGSSSSTSGASFARRDPKIDDCEASMDLDRGRGLGEDMGLLGALLEAEVEFEPEVGLGLGEGLLRRMEGLAILRDILSGSLSITAREPSFFIITRKSSSSYGFSSSDKVRS